MGDSRFPSWPLSFGDPPAINALELIVLDATRLDVHPEPTSALALINRSLRQRSLAANVHILPAARTGLDHPLHPESSAPSVDGLQVPCCSHIIDPTRSLDSLLPPPSWSRCLHDDFFRTSEQHPLSSMPSELTLASSTAHPTPYPISKTSAREPS